ncbi:MAG: acyl-ACP--UDP-N-acetylglucosamine O-acyltransferase [Bacillota bacterium]
MTVKQGVGTEIAESARVSSEACLETGVKVGARVIIGPDVVIGKNTVIESDVEIIGNTFIGSDNHIGRGVLLGYPPQHSGYQGEPTQLKIGRDNYFGPGVTIHRGTVEKGETRIGSGNYIAAFAHVAHDCQLGDRINIGNNTQVAGHVEIGSEAEIGNQVGIHQFVRIGRSSILSSSSKVIKDLPPFLKAEGHPAKLSGLGNCPREELKLMMARAYEYICHSGLNISQSVEKIKSEFEAAEITELTAFIESSSRGICR